MVTFNGRRHTSVIGERKHKEGTDTYRELAKDLARFRPSLGTSAAVECITALTDTSMYTITWTETSGRQTVTTVQSRCHGGAGQELEATLRGLPQRLSIAEWPQSTTARLSSHQSSLRVVRRPRCRFPY